MGENDFEQGVLLPKKCKNPIDDTACGECKNCLKDDIYIPCFTICMYKRIDKVPQYIRDAIVVKIIDEAHLFCTEDKVHCLLATRPKFIIIETATSVRPDNMHIMMHKLAGEHSIFREPIKPYRLYKILTKIQVDVIQGARGPDFGDFTSKLVNHKERNELIVNCIKSNPHRKIMILTRIKIHVEILKKLLIENDIEVDTLYGSKKSYKDSHVLIGTIPKMGVGFDEKNACSEESYKGRESDLLILVTTIAQIQLFIQVMGRIMRSNDPAIFYFIDDTNITKKHFKTVKETIINTKGLIYEINPKNDDLSIPDCEYNSDSECIVVKTRNPVKKKKMILNVK